MTVTEIMKTLGVETGSLLDVVCFVKKLPITNWQGKEMLDLYAEENDIEIMSPLVLISETECPPS